MTTPSADQWAHLNARISGDVFTDPVDLALTATDASIFQLTPAAVIYPRSAADVQAAVNFARSSGLSIHPRGAGSGLCGAALGTGIVLDFSRYMNRLLHLDPKNKTFTCEPGYRFGELARQVTPLGLFFPPDPSSGEYATFGGMMATNASGAHSVKYGNVSDYLDDADIVLADGERIRLSNIRSQPPNRLSPPLASMYRLCLDNRERIAAGYPSVRYNSAGYNLRGAADNGALDLRRLFTGAEGTLGVATRMTFRLAARPATDTLVVAFMDRLVDSVQAVQTILPMEPAGIEIMDKSLLRLAAEYEPSLRRHIPADIDNVLLIEFDGDDERVCIDAADTVRAMIADQFHGTAHAAVSAEEKKRFWAVRQAAVPILYRLRGRKKILALIEDAAVPTDRMVEYVEGIYDIMDRHGVSFVTYGHIAKGLLHNRPLLDLTDDGDIGLLRTLADDVFDLVYGLGGSISGEHGDGRLRSAYIRRQYPDLYPLFEETKKLLDPAGVFNPEIITRHDPEQMASDLRFGAGYRSRYPGQPELTWPERITEEIEKCHGCSKCTTVTEATRMCPVYKFTRAETASPKAKANALRALISGAVDDSTLYATRLQEVMLRCVSCGSCLRECPSNVNIPKMALEARARYIRRFGPSVNDRVLANVELAARTTRKVSGLSAPLMQQMAVRRLVDRTAGVSARRPPVIFPPRSLFERVRQWTGSSERRVLYFSGCYAGYIRPEIGESAIKVLNAAGYAVLTPSQHCCGLPMLSKGMADAARRKISANLRAWKAAARTVDHIVVTCSSCGLSLMQEWLDAAGSADLEDIPDKTVHISQLLQPDLERLPLKERAVSIGYHMPCHLKVQPAAASSIALLGDVPGVTVTDLNSHCCGMAGSWGMKSESYDLSVTIGRPMIDALEHSGADIGVTDCPTCRMQMEHLSEKPILHPVEVLASRLK